MSLCLEPLVAQVAQYPGCSNTPVYLLSSDLASFQCFIRLSSCVCPFFLAKSCSQWMGYVPTATRSFSKTEIVSSTDKLTLS